MSFLFMKNSVKRLFKIIGQADGTGIVSGRKGPELSVLMDGDISLIDTESKDYNGRICLMYSPQKADYIGRFSKLGKKLKQADYEIFVKIRAYKYKNKKKVYTKWSKSTGFFF